MSEAVAYLTVLVAAAIPTIEVLLVVPAGIIAGLPAVPTAVVGAVGNTLTLVPLVLVGDRLRGWWRHRREAARAGDSGEDVPADAGGPIASPIEPPSRRRVRARRLFDRYGLAGLALLGPVSTGVHVAAVGALAAGADRRRTVVWLTGGVVLWSGLAAAATVIGLDALVDPDRLPDLFDGGGSVR